jgi:hypothetical protein
MSTPTIPSSQKSSKKWLLFLAFCFTLLSLYPIYKNFYNGRAITTYERHVALIQGRSEYYNPWQYRMLSPLIIEGMVFVYDNTINRIYPIEEKFHFQFRETSEPTAETKELMNLMKNPRAIKYTIVFILFRFCLNFLVFALAFRLWTHFVDNRWLKLFGLMFLSLAMGNAVIASDLTFNTYLDNIFYLISACIIVKKKNPYYLLLFVPLAAFNRETSMLIPFLFFISQLNLTRFNIKSPLKTIDFPPGRVWLLTAALYLLFFAVFITVRIYYGYQTPQQWKVPPGIQMIKLNLFSAVAAKSYFEMLGLFSVLPLIICYNLKSYPPLLKNWFIFIVPIWFAVHFYSVVTYQTRLFLVPTILIMLPMVLYTIENSIRKGTGIQLSKNVNI